MPSDPPTYAVRARTALARATSGSLLLGGRGSAEDLATVSVDDEPDGSPVVWLTPDSPVVDQISSTTLATLVVPGPGEEWVLHLVGRFTPLRGDHAGDVAPCGCSAYRPTLIGARLVGPVRVSIPLEQFREAQPARRRDDEATLLDHLEKAHGEDLLACVRAHGHDALAVVPRRADGDGIEVAALGTEGVDRLQVAYPDRPADGSERLSAGWRLPVSCRCRTR